MMSTSFNDYWKISEIFTFSLFFHFPFKQEKLIEMIIDSTSKLNIERIKYDRSLYLFVCCFTGRGLTWHTCVHALNSFDRMTKKLREETIIFKANQNKNLLRLGNAVQVAAKEQQQTSTIAHYIWRNEKLRRNNEEKKKNKRRIQ